MNNRIYVFGEIQEKKRGNHGVVITHGQDGQYDSFCELLTDPMFKDLTSERTQYRPIVRCYIGVSGEHGEELVVRSQDLNDKECPVTLSELDRMIVTDHSFLYDLQGKARDSAHLKLKIA